MSSYESQPYAPPRSDVIGPGTGSAADVRLFDARSVGIATFFGSVIAGGIVLAINEARAGRRQKVATTLILSFLAGAGLFVVGMLLPDVPGLSLGFTIAQVMGMNKLAEHLQLDIVETHRSRGGQLASGWAAFGIGLGVGVALVGAVVGVVVALEVPL